MKKRKKNIFFTDDEFVSGDENQDVNKDISLSKTERSFIKHEDEALNIVDLVDSVMIDRENIHSTPAANECKTTVISFVNESYEEINYSSFQDDLGARFLSDSLDYP